MDINKLKNDVFISVYFLIKNKNAENRDRAEMSVNELANAFHIKLKKTKRYDLKKIFGQFLENKAGYREILPKLFNSL